MAAAVQTRAGAGAAMTAGTGQVRKAFVCVEHLVGRLPSTSTVSQHAPLCVCLLVTMFVSLPEAGSGMSCLLLLKRRMIAMSNTTSDYFNLSCITHLIFHCNPWCPSSTQQQLRSIVHGNHLAGNVMGSRENIMVAAYSHSGCGVLRTAVTLT